MRYTVDTTPVIAKFKDGYRISIVQAVENIIDDSVNNEHIWYQFSGHTLYETLDEARKNMKLLLDNTPWEHIEHPTIYKDYSNDLKDYAPWKTWSFTNYSQAELMRYKWWRPAIEKAFDEIEELYKDDKIAKHFYIDYIKEKYGRIDITSNWDDIASNIIWLLEVATESICSECGGKWEMVEVNWIMPYCKVCKNRKFSK